MLTNRRGSLDSGTAGEVLDSFRPASLWLYHLVRLLILGLVFAVGAGEGSEWDFYAVSAILMTAAALLAAARITVHSRGILARNILTVRWYPWESIDKFEATMRVTVVDATGNRTNCWAIQRTNAAAALKRPSRVDRVVEELEKHRLSEGVPLERDTRPTTLLVRPTIWDVCQVFVLLPVAAFAGQLFLS